MVVVQLHYRAEVEEDRVVTTATEHLEQEAAGVTTGRGNSSYSGNESGSGGGSGSDDGGGSSTHELQTVIPSAPLRAAVKKEAVSIAGVEMEHPSAAKLQDPPVRGTECNVDHNNQQHSNKEESSLSEAEVCTLQ